MPADINDFNLSAVRGKLKKKDGTTPSVMWLHTIVSGAAKANDWWIRQISAVTHIPADALRAQIKRNKELNEGSSRSDHPIARPPRRGQLGSKLSKSHTKHKR